MSPYLKREPLALRRDGSPIPGRKSQLGWGACQEWGGEVFLERAQPGRG
jgi:hypothetical protein